MSVTNELENTEVGISFMLNLVPFFSKSSDPLPIRDLPLFTLEWTLYFYLCQNSV